MERKPTLPILALGAKYRGPKLEAVFQFNITQQHLIWLLSILTTGGGLGIAHHLHYL